MAARILIVDDDPSLRDTLAEVLNDEGYEVSVAHDGLKALEEIDREAPDLVILDVMMPHMDADAFHRARRRATGREGQTATAAEPKIILLSAVPDVAYAAERVNAAAWLAKPFKLSDLLACIEETLAS